MFDVGRSMFDVH